MQRFIEEERLLDAVAKRVQSRTIRSIRNSHFTFFKTQSILSGVNTTITTKTGPRITPVTAVKILNIKE